MGTIKVLVVDDNEAFLRAATLTLSDMRGVEVLGRVNSAARALALVQANAPDMVLIDFNMPQMNGIEAAGRMRGHGYRGKIVLMSLSNEDEIRETRPNIEADAFVDKQHFAQGVAAVIESLFPGRAASRCGQ
ncbi:MAG: response regulator [Betaproteobacteria bacterium]|nr:response regulator [Betaproteobacteria bacterium]